MCADGSYKTSITFMSSFFARATAAQANETTYGVWTVVALFFAAAIVERSGHPKWVMVASFLAWTVQESLLVIGSLLRGRPALAHNVLVFESDTDYPAVATCIIGAQAIAGVAAALAWTAQVRSRRDRVL